MLTSTSGIRIRLVGKIPNLAPFEEPDIKRYRNPVMAANEDWMVFRTKENVNRSVGGFGTSAVGGWTRYSVVVMPS